MDKGLGNRWLRTKIETGAPKTDVERREDWKGISNRRNGRWKHVGDAPGENDDGDVLRPSPVHQLEPHSSAVDVTDQPHSSG
ncbi:hypothetical protein ACH5RR_026377 [Cinchona calisaya]|uniref:Uncharacterized protein n=1 Tax=Cinchona calisaya TaxID=153742 RepID=A0ABD2Z5T6_9GENT